MVLRAVMMVGLLVLLTNGAGCASALPEVATEGNEGSGEETDVESDLGVDESGMDETGDVQPICGNGLVEVGETCDEGGESAACDVDCTPVTCGDGVLNHLAGEECDGDELAGVDCEELGFDVGVLSCGGGCLYDIEECYSLPGAPALELNFSQTKLFNFSWAAVERADYYWLEESAAPGEPFVQIGSNITGESVSHEMPLHRRWEASYRLWACNGGGCTESPTVIVMNSLVSAVGYMKASNAEMGDQFGFSVALSGDGDTLAVGAYSEDSATTDIDGNEADSSATDAGSVYVFVRDGMGVWSQQAYVKASNTGTGDNFGVSVALSGDGNTLAVGADHEDSSATGINGDMSDNSLTDAGAVYVFVRDGMGTWSQQAYVKASNSDSNDLFGENVSLSEDGTNLAVGVRFEDSSATGIDGYQGSNSAPEAGAVYVFVRDGVGAWSQQAYVKASNTDAGDQFGVGLALSGDGDTLIIGAYAEDSSSTGIGGNEADDSVQNAGAVYVFVRDGMGTWAQHAYIKASNTDMDDHFGETIALSGDGNTFAASALNEDSDATGVGGNEASGSASNAGAVYVFVRDGMGIWLQQAYIKASNTDADDRFGIALALSGDGDTLAVGADREDSIFTGIGGDRTDNTAPDAGAVYVFLRDGMEMWSQHAYIKAPNAESEDRLGFSLALSKDGNTLAAGAHLEDSIATSVGGEQANNSSPFSGAVYLY